MLATPAIALSGMNASQATLRTSAHNVANLATAGFRRQVVVHETGREGGVVAQVAQVAQAATPGNALEADAVTQLQAKHAFLANLAVFRAHDRMMGALLDETV